MAWTLRSTTRTRMFGAIAGLTVIAACSGGSSSDAEPLDTSAADTVTESAETAPPVTEPTTDAEPIVVTFDLETPLDAAALTTEQFAQLDSHQVAVVEGIAATIATSQYNTEMTADDVVVQPDALISDSGDVILVEYLVTEVEVGGAFQDTKTGDEYIQALYPLLLDGNLTANDTSSVGLAVVFPPNFISDESDPLSSVIDYNDAIGGGDSFTDRPEGDPWRTFVYLDGPTIYWPYP